MPTTIQSFILKHWQPVALLLLLVALTPLASHIALPTTLLQISWIHLFSWQLLHHSWGQLLLNAAGLVLLLAIHPDFFTSKGWLVQMLLCGWLGNMLFLFINQLSIAGIVHLPLGISGALHALALLIALRLWHKPSGRLVMLALIAKLGYEQVTGTSPLASLTNTTALVDVHLYAVIAAIWIGTFVRVFARGIAAGSRAKNK